MLYVGDKFKVHWIGHEACYEGRIWQVGSLICDCRCALPSFITDWNNEVATGPMPPHLHIRATIVEAPCSYTIGDYGIFNYIDEDTLKDVRNPTFWLEKVINPGDQLSLF